MADISLHEKLIDIQQKLKVPKDNNNDFGGFKYRNIEDIEDKIKPLLSEHKLTLVFDDEPVEVGGRVYIKATARLSDGKDSVKTSAYAREATTPKAKTDDAQLTGSCSSYARKYAAGGMFLIDNTKDADSDSHGPKEDKPTDKPVYSNPTAPASEKQRQFISKKLAEQGISIEATPGHLVEQYGVTVPLTKEGAGFVIDHLIGAIK